MPRFAKAQLDTPKALTLIAACISLTTACGIGPTYRPPPPPPASLVSLSSKTLLFGTVPVASASPVQIVTVTNHSDGVLTFRDTSQFIELGFSVTSDCGAALQAQTSCTFKVIFNPQHPGVYNGNLNLEFKQYGELLIRLNGTGVTKP